MESRGIALSSLAGGHPHTEPTPTSPARNRPPSFSSVNRQNSRRNSAASAHDNAQVRSTSIADDNEEPPEYEARDASQAQLPSAAVATKAEPKLILGFRPRIALLVIGCLALLAAGVIAIGLGTGLHNANAASSKPTATPISTSISGIYNQSKIAAASFYDFGEQYELVFYQDPFASLMLTYKLHGLWKTQNISRDLLVRSGIKMSLGAPMAALTLNGSTSYFRFRDGIPSICLFFLADDGTIRQIQSKPLYAFFWQLVSSPEIATQPVDVGSHLSVASQWCAPEQKCESVQFILAYQSSGLLNLRNGTYTANTSGNLVGSHWDDIVTSTPHTVVAKSQFTLVSVDEGAMQDTVYVFFGQDEQTSMAMRLPDGNYSASEQTAFHLVGQTVSSALINGGTQALLFFEKYGAYYGVAGNASLWMDLLNLNLTRIQFVDAPSVFFSRSAFADQGHFYGVVDGVILEYWIDSPNWYQFKYVSNVTISNTTVFT